MRINNYTLEETIWLQIPPHTPIYLNIKWNNHDCFFYINWDSALVLTLRKEFSPFPHTPVAQASEGGGTDLSITTQRWTTFYKKAPRDRYAHPQKNHCHWERALILVGPTYISSFNHHYTLQSRALFGFIEMANDGCKATTNKTGFKTCHFTILNLPGITVNRLLLQS